MQKIEKLALLMPRPMIKNHIDGKTWILYRNKESLITNIQHSCHDEHEVLIAICAFLKQSVMPVKKTVARISAHYKDAYDAMIFDDSPIKVNDIVYADEIGIGKIIQIARYTGDVTIETHTHGSTIGDIAMETIKKIRI